MIPETGLAVFLATPLTKALLMLTISFGVVGFLVGIWILIRPESFFRANQFFSQWYSTRKVTKPLMVPHRTERFVYHHHRSVGLMVLAGSIYVLYALFFQYDRDKITAAFFGGVYSYPPAGWLVPGLAISLGVGAVFALVIGGFLLFRPSLLKGFEAWANQWVSARRVTKSLDAMHEGPDRFLVRRPRLVASLLILGSLYALIRLSVFVQGL